MKGFGDLNKSEKKRNKNNKFSNEQLFKQAIQFQMKGNTKEAIKIYKNIINQGCNNPTVFSNYGIILGSLGELKEAEKYFRKAIQFNPKYGLAYSNLGKLLKDLGKLQEAEISFLKAIKLKPDYVDAYYNLGSIVSNLGKSREVKLYSEKIMSIRSWSILGSYVSNREMKLD